MRSLPLHGALPEPASRPTLALGAKGFRPFFLLAALQAVLVVPLWLAIVGGVTGASAYLDPVSWHAHEMVFGFAVAVIAGFLLTAVGNWTQRETMVGRPLLALAVLWIAGRLCMLVAARLPRAVPALVDLAFLPLLALVIARPLFAARNRRNFVMVGVLATLFLANLAMHLDALGFFPLGSARRSSAVAVDLLVLVILVIAGRVFPMFTRNATGVSTIRSIAVLDVATIAGMALLVVVDAIGAEPKSAAALSCALGALGAARAVHWGARHSLREPLLWILHAGYAWIMLGLLMRALTAYIPALPATLAMHAITVGGIGSVTLGMMARVSLGHTGRPLKATPAMRWAFVAITAAALVRVAGPLLTSPSSYLGALVIAGALWSSAFATFLVVYAPVLFAPRVDGKAG
jgi:uncharacterized protein involved in response to NO